jgi:hypothetical protein
MTMTTPHQKIVSSMVIGSSMTADYDDGGTQVGNSQTIDRPRFPAQPV